MPYPVTAALQERLRADLLAGAAPETLLLLEHEPVVTLGRSANPAHVLAPATELARRGVAVHHTIRGGDVTYHGPGQLVGYPVVRLRGGVVNHMRVMADALGAVLAAYGIAARFDRAAPGLWVDGLDGAPAAKIAAFGVHVHRRVAIHGFALNVSVDLDAFHLIVPCGLAGAQVTSMQQRGVAPPSVESLADDVARAFCRAFDTAFVRVPAQAIATHAEHVVGSGAAIAS